MRRFFIFALVVVLCACSDPMETALPESAAQLENIQSTFKKLPAEEQRLLTAYIFRRELSKGFRQGFGVAADAKTKQLFSAKTIGEALKLQRDFEIKQERALAELKQQEAEAKAKKEKEEAEKAMLLKKMHAAVSVSLLGLEAVPPKERIRLFDSDIAMKLLITNNSGKEIIGIAGRVVFYDMFEEVASYQSFTVKEAIAAGKSITWSKELFGMGAASVANLKDGEYTTVFEPDGIAFSDGTKLLKQNEY